MKQDGQSVWVDLLVGDDTIRIFNNHLHSTAITVHDDKYLSEHQFLTDTAGGAKIKNIFRRFRDNSMLRAGHDRSGDRCDSRLQDRLRRF